MRGEKICAYDLGGSGSTDYGVSLEAILTGKEKIPPQGAVIDVMFEGRAEGRLAGRVRGIDYLQLRADGRITLDIRATIETDVGCRIALFAGGVGSPRPAIQLLKYMRTSASPRRRRNSHGLMRDRSGAWGR